MTPEFLAAVIDTLLPGDDVLPSGTAAGVALAAAHTAVLEMAAAQAGGMDMFARAPDSARVAVLQAVERAQPEPFRALLVAVLSDYHQSAAAIRAVGWRVEPPQPTGHSIAHSSDATAEQLERVRQRKKLWRG